MTDQEILKRVRKIMFDNMIKGYSRLTHIHFHYTKSSSKPYDSQYFWDTCFHAFILTAIGEYKMAEDHIKSLFSLQEPDGFVGHIIYWNKVLPNRITDIFQSKPTLGWRLFNTHSSALVQPPLIAQAVLNIYNHIENIEFLRYILPKLKKFYAWLEKNRDFEGDGLLSIISPFESGMDWKPTFDEVVGFRHRKANWILFLKMVIVDFRNFLRNYDLKKIYKDNYFIVKEVGFNAKYVQNLGAMAALCKIVKDPDADHYSSLKEKVLKRMMDIMYDKKDAAFYDVYGKKHKKLRVLTPTIFFPVVIKGLPESVCKEVLNRHLFNKEEFEASYPIPSVAKNDPSFNTSESLFIWRGPTWIVYNWFLYQYLKDKDYDDEAQNLIGCMKSLIEKSGFREYYNPFTGEGYGATDFTWTGLIADMIKKEKHPEEK